MDPKVATHESIGRACAILDGVKFASQEDQWRAVDAVALYIDAGMRDKQPPPIAPVPAADLPRETGPWPPRGTYLHRNGGEYQFDEHGDFDRMNATFFWRSVPSNWWPTASFENGTLTFVRSAPAPGSPPEGQDTQESVARAFEEARKRTAHLAFRELQGERGPCGCTHPDDAEACRRDRQRPLTGRCTCPCHPSSPAV